MKKIFCILLALLTTFFTGCTFIPAGEDSSALDEKITLPEGFLFGMDASCVPALEKSGVKYYDFDGSEQDVFKILSDSGIQYIRVRVWNHPFDEDGNG